MILYTDQKAKKGCGPETVDLGFDSASGQIIQLEIDINVFPA